MAGTRRKAGALTAQVEGFGLWLEQRGYTPLTVRNMLKDLGQVGVWLTEAGLEPAQFDERRAAQFLAARQARGCGRVPGLRGMRPLLSYLRQTGVVPVAAPVSSPLARLLEQYRVWMVEERGLAPITVLRYAEHRTAFPVRACCRRRRVEHRTDDRRRRACVPSAGVHPGLGRLGEGTGR